MRSGLKSCSMWQTSPQPSPWKGEGAKQKSKTKAVLLS